MIPVSVGIHVHADPDRLRLTLASLGSSTPPTVDLLLLPDGPDEFTRTALAAYGNIPQSATDKPLGVAACFNRLAICSQAQVVVLLESGCVVGRGWLEHLLAALQADPRNGLAGPSTNNSWNEQCLLRQSSAHLFAYSSHTLADVDRMSQAVRQHFGPATRGLEPLYSLADFCYMVRREVIDAIGAADESYGLGPCWEMDYNIRAARAGFRGVWACSAYVHRAPFTARRVIEETRRFDASKRLYQDKFCGLRLRGERSDYEPHCRGAECEHFAPIGLVQIHRPLFAVPAQSPPRKVVVPPKADTVPMVSCIMATRDRRDYVLQSIRYFQRQNYPSRELLILDDGTQDLSSEIGTDQRIRYLRLPPGLTIGAKRNRGCELARGNIIAQWDDDDWYAPNRLSAQAAPLLAGTAQISGLSAGVFFDLDRWQFWRCSPALHERMFVGDVHGGTLVFQRSLFEQGLRYPDRSLAEDAWFLHYAIRRGARLHKLPGEPLFIYLRHARSSWRFACGEFIDRDGWQRAPEPFLPPEDRAFYQARSAGRAIPQNATQQPLVSCIMPTANRRALVPQAIQYFRRQDYPQRELLILDDGRDPVGDLVPTDPAIRYIRLDGTRSLGAKRNLACELSAGEIIVHWDDDDWMSDRRLSYQVDSLLQQPEKDLCGLARVLFYDPGLDRAWVYVHPDSSRAWVSGNTLCYRKSLWQHHRFHDINEGEDTLFVWSLSEDRMLRLPDSTFYVATVHARNTSPKRTHHPGWQGLSAQEIRQVLGTDVAFYESWAASSRSTNG
jgi:O-antigen biosynthesis protein